MTRDEMIQALEVERFGRTALSAEPMPERDHELLTQRRKRALLEADREYQRRHSLREASA